MTRHLYVMRHGIAVPHGAPEYPDDQRPLTEKGERHVRQVAKTLRRYEPKLDRILTSPLPRALRTAEIVADVLHAVERLEIADTLSANRSAVEIADWVATRPEANLLLVGHNPAVSDLISRYLGQPDAESRVELRKGGIAAFRSEAPNESPSLDWLASPKLLRRLSDA